MAADPQAEIVAFLARAEAYGATGPVERISTHISHVFLAGPRAYKLKRAVRFSYLDFSTPTRRRAACANELAVNRRTAPRLYLGLAPIARGPDGALRLGPVVDHATGEALDWVVVMRRFDQEALWDRRAAAGLIAADEVDALAETIAAFHESAMPAPGFGGAAAMAATLAGNTAEIARHVPAVFTAAEAGELAARLADLHARVAPLLDRRRAAGLVRHGHGDLHLRNIAEIDGAPVLFDAIEFADTISHIDVLYDLAFLLMDLVHRDLGWAANRVLNRYLDHAIGRDHLDGLAALPLFLAVRAAIRAHTTAAAASGPDDRRLDEARSYLALARRLAAPPPPLLVAVGGLSGSGKSTVAAALAPALGPVPGAVVLRTDAVRKRLLGAGALDRLPSEAYGEAVTERVYAALRAEAAAVLAAGHAVIADAVHAREGERAAIAATAARANAAFRGFWLEAPVATRVGRVALRTKDVSDAGPAVVRAQEAYDLGPIAWTRIAATGSAAETVAAMTAALRSTLSWRDR